MNIYKEHFPSVVITIDIDSWNSRVFKGTQAFLDTRTIINTSYDTYYIKEHLPDFVKKYPEFFI